MSAARDVRTVRRHFEQLQGHPTDRALLRARTLIVRELLGPLSDASILDVGCGDASISRQYLDGSNRLTLVDYSAAMLESSRGAIPAAFQPFVTYVHADFLRHDLGRRFDVVLCIGVVAHVESVEQAIRKLASLCRPGGRCVLEFTDSSQSLAKFHHAWTRTHARLFRSPGYVTNRLTGEEIVRLAAGVGLRHVGQRRYSLRLPGMRHLPERWLWRYEGMTLRSRLLNRFGADTIVVFVSAA